LQGRGGSTESLTRLGVGSDREEQEEKTTLYDHVLTSVPVLRMNAGTTCACVREQLQQGTVGAIEQRCVVNSGVRGAKNNHLRTEMDCASIAPNVYPIMI
jgi:hypothetical protein